MQRRGRCCQTAAREGQATISPDGQRLIQRDRPLGNPVSECRPLHQLQHQRPRARGFLDAVDGGDVGVVETGEDLRLPREPGEAIRVSREGVGQDPRCEPGSSFDLL